MNGMPQKQSLSKAKIMKYEYTVDCTNGIWSGKEFTSRRKAESYIARLRRVYPQLLRERRQFTIRKVSQ